MGRGLPTPLLTHKYGRESVGGYPYESPGSSSNVGCQLRQICGCAAGAHPLYITADTVMEVEKQLSGWGGPRGMDAVSLKHWLLFYLEASDDLRKIVSSLVGWLENDRPLWVVYCALMVGRLIRIDKQPGVRPIGIIEA